MVGRFSPIFAVVLCVVLAAALLPFLKEVDNGDSELMQLSSLHLYPVNEQAVEQYIEHAERSQKSELSSFHSSKRMHAQHRLKRKLSKMRQLNLHHNDRSILASDYPSKLKIVPRSQSEMLSDDAKLLNDAVGQVSAQPLDDPTLKEENSYVLQGTAYPHSVHVAATPMVAFTDKPDIAADAAATSGGSVGSELTAAAAPDCSGPVRHTDTPLCVAKKAMAQALQAEKDVQSVDGALRSDKLHTEKLQGWERQQHQSLAESMTREFHTLDDKADEERRRIGDVERQTISGDRVVELKAEQAHEREQGDFEAIDARIKGLKGEASMVSEMTGPEGPPGPRMVVLLLDPCPATREIVLLITAIFVNINSKAGIAPPNFRFQRVRSGAGQGSTGYQGAEGPQGERGPEGYMGPMGLPGQEGPKGADGVNGARGPVG